MAAFITTENKKHIKVSPNVSTNPFLLDVREIVQANMDSLNQMGSGRGNNRNSRNPFVARIELTLAVGHGSSHTGTAAQHSIAT